MIKRLVCLFLMTLFMSTATLSHAEDDFEPSQIPQIAEPLVGSWAFSGVVLNESGDRFGYFFQIHRQGSNFHAQTAIIDGQTNKLVMYYEGDERIADASQLNWHVGRAFIRFNPVNERWVFGLKSEDNKGFNFKVDMLKQPNQDKGYMALRPGVELHTVQTNRLNGHIQTSDSAKDQFVMSNNAWFGKIWFSTEQRAPHHVSSVYCRLADNNGFYSVNLREKDATAAAVAEWLDALGNKVTMSQFVSVQIENKDACTLNVVLPKVHLTLLNALSEEGRVSQTVAGFSQGKSQDFCFISDQSYV